jgi:hypothetical protein
VERIPGSRAYFASRGAAKSRILANDAAVRLIVHLVPPSGSGSGAAAFDRREPLAPMIDIHVEKGPLRLRLFSALTTLGTPVDVTAQECRLETRFPADAESDAALHSLALAH